ncbi:transcriptional regulator ATRX homolog [Drosophila kikkawai]|uniref:Transcriptional regulator ATRX homolog n=1 Tax=Drosophila kikkawai TaxID=30033 RepID=A0A6P4I420_DROKI|nr:titin [Drosophila kikkawai]
MESTKENDAGVLAPSQEDAIAAETNTPVAKKTRQAMRKRMDSTVDESELHSEPPKTPGTMGSGALGSETPRRSCRKSVRPPIDYEDIVRSAKKLISDEIDVQEEGQQPAVHKWNAAEVGKSTRKRARKSKRMTSKKLKAEQDEQGSTGTEQPGDKLQEEDKPEQLKDNLKQSDVQEMQAEDKPEQLKDNLKQPDVKEMQPEDKLEQSGLKEKQPGVNEAEDIIEMPKSKSKNKTVSRKSYRVTKKADTPAQSTLKKKRNAIYKHIVGDEDIEELGLTPLDAESCEEDAGEKTLQNDKMVPLALEEKFAKTPETLGESYGVGGQAVQEEEMPLQPLEEEEMASLIMLDDDDEAEVRPLNTTFDADDIKQEDLSVILVDSPLVESVREGPKSSIKVVLTNSDDKNETLLNLEYTSQKPKGNPFPMPFVTKTELFDSSEPSESDQNKLKAEPRYGRRRSKSANGLNDDTMSRTVSFRNSPIEIVSVAEIDHRWKEAAAPKNVTNRRKRSKSLDEKIVFTSRLPKPKIQGLPKPKPVTPSQVKKRTKLPDFSALHQKEFAKMESLVDHVERKAERAKILTTSALKKPLGSAAKQAQGFTSAAERIQGARPKASKKFDIAAVSTVAAKNPEKSLPPSRLPLKSAHNVTAVPRPAFNLSTATVKTFNATFSSKPAEPRKDKLAERRQRHMDMFKGRAATKAPDKKAAIIRGVRTNRRFELQMQHRKHLEED